MPRTLDDKQNKNLTLRTFPEMAAAIRAFADRDNRRRGRRGEDVGGGEKRGHAYQVNRLMCWYMALCEEDRTRIQEEGTPLLDRLFELPDNYEGPLPFEAKTETVFRSRIDAGHPVGEDISRKSGGEVVGRHPKSRRNVV